jgi:hypothetical protein
LGSGCRTAEGGEGGGAASAIVLYCLHMSRLRVLHNLMPKVTPIRWLDAPEKQDYPSAQSYLELLFEPAVAAKYVKALEAAAMTSFKAKDIFRASGLSLLGVSNSHVERDRAKIAAATSLSPLLLVRDAEHGRVIIADGYHRLCAVYACDEDALIPCKVV